MGVHKTYHPIKTKEENINPRAQKLKSRNMKFSEEKKSIFYEENNEAKHLYLRVD